MSTESLIAATQEISGCKVVCIAFDFDKKTERKLPFSEVRAAMEGCFVWIDVDICAQAGEGEAGLMPARALLADLCLVHDETVEDVLSHQPATQTTRFDDYMHLTLTGCRLRAAHFDPERLDCLFGEHFLLTVHRGKVGFLESMKKDYRADFVRFARTPSFLIYELWDHLIDNYVEVQKHFEERVEHAQKQLIGEVDERVFASVSELGADLLNFRKVLLPARAVLTDLSRRKTIFISEATLPFLSNMVGVLERVLQDLLVDRDILSESLNLYMSMVGHRTNLVMKKLTVFTVLFLPLTFLTGVYGMNFEIMPHVKWGLGFHLFIVEVVGAVILLYLVMRWIKLL